MEDEVDKMKKLERRMALICPYCDYIFPFIPSIIKMKEGTEVYLYTMEYAVDGIWGTMDIEATSEEQAKQKLLQQLRSEAI